jgi:GSCFA family
MIFTFGLTEAWISRQDGAVFPACPGTVRGVFDPQQHEFVNFNVDEITHDFCELIREVAAINSRIRYIIAVSPVPIAATATGSHVVTASTYSKAVLRVAVDQIVRRSNGAVVYFPAYEIAAGTQAPHSFFQTDRRNVSATAVEEVMGVFLGFCDCHYSGLACNRNDNRADQSFVEAFSRRISDAACEEAMVENS